MLFQAYIDRASENSPANLADPSSILVIVQLIEKVSRDHLREAVEDGDMRDLMNDFSEFETSLSNGT